MFNRVGTAAALAVAITGFAAVSSASAEARGAGAVADIADRGASAFAPEDTIAAIDEAKTQKAQLVRLDVQPTKDGTLVLMHDALLGRTTDVESHFPDRAPWNVRDFTVAEIKTLDAGSWFAPDFTGERVPTLTEALAAADQDGLGVIINAPADQAAEVARELGGRRATSSVGEVPNLVVESTSETFLKSFDKLARSIPTSLAGTPGTDRLHDLGDFVDVVDVPTENVTADYVNKIHESHMAALTGTVNFEDPMRAMIAAGVDGILTARPDVLNTVLTGSPAPAA